MGTTEVGGNDRDTSHSHDNKPHRPAVLGREDGKRRGIILDVTHASLLR